MCFGETVTANKLDENNTHEITLIFYAPSTVSRTRDVLKKARSNLEVSSCALFSHYRYFF